MNERFLRSEMLLGSAAMDRLAGAHVCVVGLGGVGSCAAEVLARSGVGELTLIDRDTYSLSNINRQLGALSSTAGRPKAEVLAERARDINPDCRVHPLVGTYAAADRERFWGGYDCVVDCIDLVSCKVDLICQARERGIPILSLLEVTDLSKTRGCPLARVMRRELGRRGIRHLKVVYSPEEPVWRQDLEEPPPGRRSVPGSVSWVPTAAGILLGGAAVMALTGGLIPQKADREGER